MHFESEQWKYLVPRQKFPCVVLERGRPWDDYTYKTSFRAYYRPDANQEVELGTLKILQRDQKRTELPVTFTALDERYCSLGQTLEFYERIRELGLDVAGEILTALRDTAFNPALHAEFEQEKGYQLSLLRASSALWALKTAGALFGRPTAPIPAPSFTYTKKLDGFDVPHQLEITFEERAEWLGRAIALVGRNGAGKTVLLGGLAHALSGLEKNEVPGLGSARPLVSQVIAISYSAFDTFRRPFSPELGVNYIYCGLRDATNHVNMDWAMSAFDEATLLIQQQNRAPQWTQLLKESGILEEFSEPERITQLPDADTRGEWLRKQSSGHKLLLLILARVLAHIRPGSILLFDEPETHLHPQLLSGMMRLLHRALQEFRSYAIIATHSPIVLQEIPARDIRILEREGNVPIISRYPTESFGESLTEIVNTAFRVDERHKNYFRILRQLVNTQGTREGVANLFNKKLSLNARMALHALTAKPGERGNEKP
jgi:hypothetical protein